MKIEMRDPLSLKLHPFFEGTYHPMMPKESAQWLSFVEDVRDHGVMEPLKITPDGMIMDGRHRHAAALETMRKEVPCIVLPDGDALMVVAQSLLLRRNYTKSGLALQLAAMADVAASAGKGSRSANLKNGKSKKANVPPKVDSIDHGKSPTLFASLESMSVHYGVSRDLLIQARKVHDFLDQIGDEPHPSGKGTIRDWTFDMVYEQEKGFQPVLASLGFWAGGDTHKQSCAPGARSDYARYIETSITKTMDHWTKWDKVKEDDRQRIMGLIPEMVAAWPEDFRRKVASAAVSLSKGAKSA